MATTTAPHVPLPPGAVSTEDWQPNDGGHYYRNVCYIHADLPDWNIDTCVSLTATEALQMATALISVAYLMQGGEEPN